MGTEIKYKGYIISDPIGFQHPKLYGRYEIYNEETEKHLDRALTIKEAKKVINDKLNEKI